MAWAAGFLLLGAIFGGIATNVGDVFTSPEARVMIEALGGKAGLTDAFIAAELGFMGILAAAYGIQASLHLRQEEASSHAEALLATQVRRLQWAGGHVVIALAGTAILLLLAGLSSGASLAVQTGDAQQIGRVLSGALVQLPAAWMLAGIAVALFGLAPRFVQLTWVALVAFVLLGELGAILEPPAIILDLSPFAHVPRVPAMEIAIVPLLRLALLVAILLAVGLAGFRRRDVA